MTQPLRFLCFTLAALTALASSAQAEVKLASVFTDSMVLQCDMPAPVWGWADAGEEVTVQFGGQKKKAVAGKDGKWQVNLDKLSATAEPHILIVEGSNKIELKDVLVGEVWICSGQSNMEWPLAASLNAKEEIAAAKHPQIRLFNVMGHNTSPVAQDTLTGQWKVCSPESVNRFSAVGYFFGRRLQKELNTPIGLIGSNWGGTRIEPWVSPAGFHSVPELKKTAEQVDAYTKSTKVGGSSPSAIYNAMIHPLAPFAMRGGIWYQGESNGGEGETYYQKKKALIAGWRKLFNPDLAFYWVQLANFRAPNEKPEGGDGWARIREAQRKALEVKHTGMAVITDIGAAGDIHPRNKQDVGSRLAQWALHQTYDKKELVPSGPLYKSQKIEGDKIVLHFNHVGGGLIAGEKKGLEAVKPVQTGLKHFAIAGADKKWYWADAKISGDTVVVSSDEVKAPVAVRYAYTTNPEGANLYNKDGMPASPFRTDSW